MTIKIKYKVKNMKDRLKVNKVIKEFKKEVGDGIRFKIGINEEEGSKPHPSGEHGETIADFAAANHYGTDLIPSRPFISGYMESYENDMEGAAKKQLQKVIKKIGKGKKGSFDDEYQAAADEMADGIKSYIDSEPFVPNAPKTVEKKGHDFPLVETATMYDSITGKFEKK